jgi:transcription antitermination factor NusG
MIPLSAIEERQTEPVPAGSGATELVWICLRSKPRKENALARALGEDRLIEVFCPLIRFRRPTQRGAVWFQEALFPGYLFVRLDPARDLRRVASTQGSIGPVSFADQVATIPAPVIQSLREPYGESPRAPLTLPEPIAPGDHKQIADGPLRGLACTVVSYLPARQRVAILVDFLGQTITAHVSPGSLFTRREAAETRTTLFATPLPAPS